MARGASALIALGALAAAVAVSGHAAPKAAAPLLLYLDLRTGTFANAPWPAPADVSYQDSNVIVDGKTVDLGHPVLEVSASPDGSLVAAQTYDTSACAPPPPPCGDFAVWVLNRDGSGLRLVSDAARYPSWSPDSRRLAFVGSYDTSTLSGVVSVANVDGTHRRSLGGRELAARAVWSSGGTLLAYTREARRSSVRVVRLGDARVVAVLDRAASPAWASSGSRLAVVRSLGGRDALAVWERGRLHVLARSAPGMIALSWSHDDRRIAFATDGTGAAVGVVRAGGGGAHMFRIPGVNSRNGAYVDRIVWRNATTLFVAGIRYGVLPD